MKKKTRAKINEPEFEGADFTGPPYCCMTCGYTTTKISSYKSHLKRQNKCEPSISTMIICDCLEEFGNMTALEKHRPVCLYLRKKKTLAERNITVIDGTAQHITIENNVRNNTNGINNANNVNNIGNNNGNNNGNNTTNLTIQNLTVQSPHIRKDIALYTYSLKNKFLYLTPLDREFLMNEKYDPYIMYCQLTYCSSDKYQFHSLYYPDIKKDKINVYNGKEWETRPINFIVSNIIKYISRDLLCFIEDNFCPDKKVCKKIKKRVSEVYNIDNDNTSVKDYYDELVS